jgi:hypothetical protein
MTGQELYAMYVIELAIADCGCDGWDDLEAMDKAAWNGMAAKLEVQAVLQSTFCPQCGSNSWQGFYTGRVRTHDVCTSCNFKAKIQ